jgi:ADP-ribosylglycohydrolase
MRAKRPKLNPHARAVFAGLCIGDASGVPREFARMEAPLFPQLATGPHNLMMGGGPFSLAPAQTTDDSATALCVWQSLRACGWYAVHDVARLLVNWHRETFDVGSQTAAALRLIEAGVKPEEAGRRVWEERARQPAGNGSLMRCVPIGVYFAEAPDARRAASLADSAITHFDPRCQIACSAFNAAIALACTSEGKATAADLLDAADEEIDLAAEEVSINQTEYGRARAE